MNNIREAEWVKEFAIRQALGGYYPKDPFKQIFFQGLLSIKNQKISNNNKHSHLLNLIRKNR